MLTKEELITFEQDIAAVFATGVIRAPVHLRAGREEALINVFKEYKISDDDYVFRGFFHISRVTWRATLSASKPSRPEIIGLLLFWMQSTKCSNSFLSGSSFSMGRACLVMILPNFL